jgi:hypothetical protein
VTIPSCGVGKLSSRVGGALRLTARVAIFAILAARLEAVPSPIQARALEMTEEEKMLWKFIKLETQPDCRSSHWDPEATGMCRNIKTLFNFDPPVTDDEVRAASLQFVRKISGFNKPSKANEGPFLAAIDEVAGVSIRLLRSLETNAPPKNREEEAAKARARAEERFGA